MRQAIDDNDITHIRLPQEVRLATLLNETERDLYNYFCQSIEYQTDSIDAMNDIYLRLQLLLRRSELTPYTATLEKKNIAAKATTTIRMMQDFFEHYETQLFANEKEGDFINTRQVLRDTVDCIHKLSDVYYSIHTIQHYLQQEMKSVPSDGNIYTLLLDIENLIVFAKHFFDKYISSAVSSDISCIYNKEKRHLLQGGERGERESGPETKQERVALNDIIEEIYTEELEEGRSHEDMLFRLFFMYRYESIIHSLVALESNFTELREFEHTKNDLITSKKKYKEITEYYITAKDEFQEIYILLEEIHKNSACYNQNMEGAINNLYRTLCKETEHILDRMFVRIGINYN